jgi:23S rRNA-/tRNA-specific pseudouridylate synthase
MQKIRLHKLVADTLNQEGSKYSEYTSKEIQRNIENYGVYVSGSFSDNRMQWVFTDDQIDLSTWPERKKGDFSKIKILSESRYHILIYKPKGLVVQPGAGHQKDNLLVWLFQNYPKQKLIKSETAGLVHRIDKDTQGLLLIAKDENSLKFFQDQFRERSVEKKYLAVLKGQFNQNLIIQNYQARDKVKILRQKLFWSESKALEYDTKARYAKSIFYPKVNCPELNLCIAEVKIFTGRMHQIRLQAEGLGLPLHLDEVYKSVVNDQDLPIQKIRPASDILELNENNFNKLRKEIFLGLDYSLLSNYLKLKIPDNTTLEAVYYEFDQVKK